VEVMHFLLSFCDLIKINGKEQRNSVYLMKRGKENLLNKKRKAVIQ
jgi:hypothetical protein